MSQAWILVTASSLCHSLLPDEFQSRLLEGHLAFIEEEETHSREEFMVINNYSMLSRTDLFCDC